MDSSINLQFNRQHYKFLQKMLDFKLFTNFNEYHHTFYCIPSIVPKFFFHLSILHIIHFILLLFLIHLTGLLILGLVISLPSHYNYTLVLRGSQFVQFVQLQSELQLFDFTGFLDQDGFIFIYLFSNALMKQVKPVTIQIIY